MSSRVAAKPNFPWRTSSAARSISSVMAAVRESVPELLSRALALSYSASAREVFPPASAICCQPMVSRRLAHTVAGERIHQNGFPSYSLGSAPHFFRFRRITQVDDKNPRPEPGDKDLAKRHEGRRVSGSTTPTKPPTRW